MHCPTGCNLICPNPRGQVGLGGTSLGPRPVLRCRLRVAHSDALAAFECLMPMCAAAAHPAPSSRARDGHPEAAAADGAPGGRHQGDMSRRTCLVRSGWVELGRVGSGWSRLLGSARSGLLGSEMLGSVGRLDPLVGHGSCMPCASSFGECVAERRQGLSGPFVPTHPGPPHDCMISTTCNGMSPHVPRTP